MTTRDDPYRFREWRGILASMADLSAKQTVFREACLDIASQTVAGRVDKATAVDELVEEAEVCGLIEALGREDIESVIGDALKQAEQNKPNGKHQHAPKTEALPVINPFPCDPKTLPRRPWLVPGLLLRRQVTLIVAPPGSGKSLLTLQMAMLCCSSIMQWAKWQPRAVCRVLVINVEEDEDEMKRRLCAAAQIMNIAQNDLGGLFLAHTESIVVARADSRTKTVVATPMLDRIQQTIKENQIDIVIVDPFAETFAGDENSNSELKWAAVLWREVARHCDTSVVLVHHAKKYSTNMAGDMDAGRGGGALAGVARIVATLFSMTEREAEAFDGKKCGDGTIFDMENRHRYLRFDDAKANLALINANARWFYKHSIKLDNGGNGEPGDEVGVLMPWLSPSVFDNMSTNDANTILTLIDKGYCDEDGNPIDPMILSRAGASKRWAGHPVMQVIGCNDKDAQAILRKWAKEGVLHEREVVTKASKGRKQKCLFVDQSKRPGHTTYSDTML